MTAPPGYHILTSRVSDQARTRFIEMPAMVRTNAGEVVGYVWGDNQSALDELIAAYEAGELSK